MEIKYSSSELPFSRFFPKYWKRCWSTGIPSNCVIFSFISSIYWLLFTLMVIFFETLWFIIWTSNFIEICLKFYQLMFLIEIFCHIQRSTSKCFIRSFLRKIYYYLLLWLLFKIIINHIQYLKRFEWYQFLSLLKIE